MKDNRDIYFKKAIFKTLTALGIYVVLIAADIATVIEAFAVAILVYIYLEVIDINKRLQRRY